MLAPDFYKTKSLSEMNMEEWEALCDGCGNCCYQKIITGYGSMKSSRNELMTVRLQNFR